MRFLMQSEFFAFIPAGVSRDHDVESFLHFKTDERQEFASPSGFRDFLVAAARNMDTYGSVYFSGSLDAKTIVRGDEMERDGFFEVVLLYPDGKYQIFTLRMLEGSVGEAFSAFEAAGFAFEEL